MPAGEGSVVMAATGNDIVSVLFKVVKHANATGVSRDWWMGAATSENWRHT